MKKDSVLYVCMCVCRNILKFLQYVQHVLLHKLFIIIIYKNETSKSQRDDNDDDDDDLQLQ